MCDLLPEFLIEADGHLDALEAALAQLGRGPADRSVLSGMLRRLHTLKGTAGFLGLSRVEALSHGAEAYIEALRDGPEDRLVDDALLPALLVRLRGLAAALARSDREPAGTDADLLDQLAGLDGRVAGLDRLSSTVSELGRAGDALASAATPGSDPSLADPLATIRAVAQELRASVEGERRQPVAAAWSRLPRLVRDLSLELGKPIRFVVAGGETELDRATVERLRDGLVQLVRNAADHGLEDAARREAAGKPATGTIRLDVSGCGGAVTLRLSDDGGGLDADAIRRRLRERALLPDGVIARLTDDALAAWIFAPGFSTAATVTTTSGRGLGLDVVKTSLAAVGGTVSVRSIAGIGTAFTLSVPRNLAVPAAARVPARPGRLTSALLVDGNPLLRSHLSSVLSGAGFHVTAADGASRALHALEGGSFAAAIVARHLGDEDGLGLLARIRTHPGHGAMTLVLLATSPTDRDLAEAHGLGATVVSRLDHEALLDALARPMLAAA